MKKSRKRFIGNLMLFLVILIVTFYIIFKNQDITKIIDIISDVDLKYILMEKGTVLFSIFYEKLANNNQIYYYV